MSLHGVAKHGIFAGVVLSLLLVTVLTVHSLHKSSSSAPPAADNLSIDPCDRQGQTARVRVPTVETRTDGSLEEIDFVNAGDSRGSESGSEGAPEVKVPELTVRPVEASALTGPREPGYVIRGKVVSEAGPVHEEPGQWPQMLAARIKGPGYARDSRIDEQGGFRCAGLDAGSYVVSVVDVLERHRLLCEPVEVRVGPEAPSRDVAFVLGQEVPVVVIVLERESFEPVAGTPVVAESIGGSGAAGGTTDEQGCCVLSLIPGRYCIDAPRWEDGRQIAVDPQTRTVGPGAQALSVRLLVRAREERMLRGILVDARDNPVKGYVCLDSVGWEDMEPAEFFSLALAGPAPAGGFGGYACDVSGSLARRFHWQEGTGQMTLVLEPRTKIVGRLVNTAGQPLSGARLCLQAGPYGGWRSEHESLYSVTVDDSGHFQFEGVAVGLTLRVAAYHGRNRGYSDPIDLKPGATHDIGSVALQVSESPSPTGHVRVRIIDENGVPMANRTTTVSFTADRDGRLVRTGGRYTTRTDGSLVTTGLPLDQAVTLTVEVPGYGVWSKTTVAGDPNCTFQVYPQGWDLLGAEAPPLVVDRWFNHAPMTWEELRGSVVLLIFGDLYYRDPRGMSPICTLCRQYGPQGLVVIVVLRHLPEYAHLPEHASPDREHAVQQTLSHFDGAPIAGCLDADADLITDPMPDGRLPATAGATHRLYRVSVPPALFLIDKAGKVRFRVEPQDAWERVNLLLKE